jgi:hypothetical protein
MPRKNAPVLAPESQVLQIWPLLLHYLKTFISWVHVPKGHTAHIQPGMGFKWMQCNILPTRRSLQLLRTYIALQCKQAQDDSTWSILHKTRTMYTHLSSTMSNILVHQLPGCYQGIYT